MTDYSEPIGWWCPGCNGEGPNFAVCCGVHSVPRYAVIPEGERPQTCIVNLDELEVCTCVDDDGDVMVASGDVVLNDIVGWVIAGYQNLMANVEGSDRINCIARVSAHYADMELP